jgi:hypothetical protein
LIKSWEATRTTQLRRGESSAKKNVRYISNSTVKTNAWYWDVKRLDKIRPIMSIKPRAHAKRVSGKGNGACKLGLPGDKTKTLSIKFVSNEILLFWQKEKTALCNSSGQVAKDIQDLASLSGLMSESQRFDPKIQGVVYDMKNPRRNSPEG